MSSEKEIVNYLDIKLSGISSLPEEWTQGMPTDTNLYAQNPFRYTVTFDLPNKVNGSEEANTEEDFTHYAFENGRLLPALPRYVQYIATAAPPSLPGIDEVNTIRDFPETVGELQQNGETLEDTASPQSPADAPLELLWAVNCEEAPPAQPSDKKGRKKGGSTADSVVGKEDNSTVSPLPPLPEVDEQPPCVIRVPLTAVQERALETVVRQKKTLEMRFRRVLRPYLPADWEDMNAKYYEATIPVSLEPLTVPGSVELKEKVLLEPLPLESDAEADRNPKKKAAARKAAKSGQPPTMYEEPAEGPHHYTVAETKATLELRLRHTLTRLSSDRVRPTVMPSQLIPTRTRTNVSPPPRNVSSDFEDAIQDMAAHLLREYYDVNPNEAKSTASTLEEREARRVRFLDYFQSTGQILAYKTKLSGLVLRMVEDKFRTDPAATAEDVGKLQNELYVYLLEHMHLALQQLMDQYEKASKGQTGDTERPSLSPERDSPTEVEEEKEIPDAPTNPVDIWYQRAQEAEITGEYSLASSCHQARIASYEGNRRYPELWTDAAAYYHRTGDASQAEVCYREAIACSPTYLPALMGYGMYLLSYERLKETAVFLHSAADLAPHDGLPWAAIYLLNSLHISLLKEGNPHYSNEAAKWRREREDAMQQALQRFSESDSEVNEEKVLLRLAQYALQLHHRELANICLCHCEPSKSCVEILYARLFIQAEQYREALHTLGELEETQESTCTPEEMDELNVLRAECEAALGHTQQAVTLYKKALCPQNSYPEYLQPSHAIIPPSQEVEVGAAVWRRRSFLTAYIRLGNILLGEGKYRDALGVFAVTIKLWPSSLAWLGAGIAYYRCGNLECAEECLCESNAIDPSNPRTWGYLSLLAIRLQSAGVEDTLQQLRLHDLKDASLWAEVGRELLTINRGSLAEWCLRRALFLENADKVRYSPLSCTTRYYLAQILVEQQRWEEAQELLEAVAQNGSNEVLKAKAEEGLLQLKSIM